MILSIKSPFVKGDFRAAVINPPHDPLYKGGRFGPGLITLNANLYFHLLILAPFEGAS